MCTTPVTRTASAPRYRAVRAMADRAMIKRGGVVTVAPWLSWLGHEARNRSLQRGGLALPDCGRGGGDDHRGCSRAGHEAGDLAVGGFRSRVVVDDACAAPGAEGQVAGSGEHAHTPVALATVVFRAEVAPVRECLRPLPRGSVEVAVDPVAGAEKGHGRRPAVGLEPPPSGRVRECAAPAASNVPTGWRRGRAQ